VLKKITILLEELWPEVWQSENLLKENIVLRASLGPLVELVHYIDVTLEVINGFHL
jgi:hypothetical protein